MSLGQDVGEVPYQVRGEVIPDAARFRRAGRGIAHAEKGRTEVPYWVSTDAEARKAVQENAALKVDIIKIWVDDRNGIYKKLTPELYGAIIDEAHKAGIRVTAHIFDLSDAKGLLRAGLDAFAHGVEDRDIDEEFVGMVKERPQVVLVPNLPGRGVATDLSWVSDTVPAGELQKLQAAAVDDPAAQKVFGIQARNLAKLSSAGMRIALGTDGNTPYRPAPRDGGHGGGGDDAAPGSSWPRRATLPTSCGSPTSGRWKRGRARTSWYWTPILWTTSRTPVASTPSTCAALLSIARACGPGGQRPRRSSYLRPFAIVSNHVGCAGLSAASAPSLYETDGGLVTRRWFAPLTSASVLRRSA